jgi:catechol 2,3-dioxygenase-like lactoylglutathione lyase family enzyme
VVGEVNACVPVVYVTDVPTSVAFYGLLGLACQVTGQDGEWHWAYLKTGEVGLLLAGGGSVWSNDPGPVLLYLRTDDVSELVRCLEAAGMPVEHLGYPDHAPGGEVKVVDPDGHVLMVGQVAGTPPADRVPAEGDRYSILARAASAARARGHDAQRCQFPLAGGRACPKPAEVKMADSWGDSAWTCLPHAEELMINAKGVFIAAEDAEGLAPYLRRRQGIQHIS